MNLKKGFTLAEVLIVLIVIGVIATLTIPSLMRGVQEAQWKTAYKKAFNSIVNVTATERVQIGLPAAAGQEAVQAIYDALKSNLSVKYYAAADAADDQVAANGAYVTEIDDDAVDAAGSPWIISDDGLAYQVVNGANCGSKADILEATTQAAALEASCTAVLVDVNGLGSLPNHNGNYVELEDPDARTMEPLEDDRYYVYIGTDGATAGHRAALVTGRIVGGGR